MAAQPDREAKRDPETLTALLAALTEFQQTGTVSLRCDQCGQLVTFDDHNPRYITYSCGCDKYKGSLKGL